MAREKAQKLEVSVTPLTPMPIEPPVLLDGKQEIYNAERLFCLAGVG